MSCHVNPNFNLKFQIYELLLVAVGRKQKFKKRNLGLLGRSLAFFPTFYENCVLLQWNWLSWCIVHWPHPKYCLCWANANASSVGDASFWIKYKCFTSLPSFYRFYSQYIWTKSGTNFYT